MTKDFLGEQEHVDVAAGVRIQETLTHNVFTGTLAALLLSGVIEGKHLVPQPGRRRGYTYFMADGSPVPAMMPNPSQVAQITVCSRDEASSEVRIMITEDESTARGERASTLISSSRDSRTYRGSRERLLRDGVPPAWLEDIMAPGKKRGRRKFHDAEHCIEVYANEKQITVEVNHIDRYKRFGRDLYLMKRAEFGLPLVVRRHLTLVWSQPEVRRSGHASI